MRLPVLVAALALAGCSTKPYARDPLVSDGRAVRGDHAARPGAAPAEPDTPRPPAGPTIGTAPPDRLTSR